MPHRTALHRTCTGVDGPASLILLPWWSMRALTLPQAPPATKMSPTRRVPRWISTVPTVPAFKKKMKKKQNYEHPAHGVSKSQVSRSHHHPDQTRHGECLWPSFKAHRTSKRAPLHPVYPVHPPTRARLLLFSFTKKNKKAC